MHVRIFRYHKDLDAFEATPEYRDLAARLGLAEWNPVVWLGRYFALDNDFGEHWFDNWDEREALEERARELGFDANELFILNPDRFQDGRDGPCHTPEMRRRFWTDVLMSLELSVELLFDEARENNRRAKELLDGGNEMWRDEYIPDLEERIELWRQENRRH